MREALAGEQAGEDSPSVRFDARGFVLIRIPSGHHSLHMRSGEGTAQLRRMA
jgi:hypothetical protein